MIKLELTEQEINLVLTCMGKQPAEMVYNLLGKIHAQVEPQLKVQLPPNNVPKKEKEIEKDK